MTVSWKTAIELGIGIFEFGAVYALITYFVEKKMIWLVVAGILSGFALGSKYTSLGFGFVPALALIGIGSYLAQENTREITKRLLIFCACALIVSAPWFLRNLIETGNPVFPYFWEKIGFGKIKMAGTLFSDPPAPKFTFYNYALFLWPLTMGTLQQESFPGVFFLAFVPFLFFFRRVDRKIKLLLTYFAVSLVIWAFLGRFYVRYFIPTLSVISVIMAYFLFQSPQNRFFKNIIVMTIFFIVVINAALANNILLIMQDPWPYVVGTDSKVEYLSTWMPGYPDPYYPTVTYANKNLPKGSRILFVGEARSLFCKIPYTVSGVSDLSPLVEWTKFAKNSRELYGIMRAHGITHILLNVPEAKRVSGYDIFYWDITSLKIFNDFWKQYVKEVYRGIGDMSIPYKGIFSMKKQQPAWWNQYCSDPKNYVYLYEIISEQDATRAHEAPHNFLLESDMYSKERWQKLEPFIREIF